MNVQQLVDALPHRVKIGAYDYRIELRPRYPEEPEGVRFWGFCDANQYILIFHALHEAPNNEFLVGVVLHEILHAVWDEKQLGKRPDEEKVVTRMELGLLNFMRDNPKMMAWIKKGLK